MPKPISPEYRRAMNALMGAIDAHFNPGARCGGERTTSVVMLVFPFGSDDERRCSYISNGVDRKDMAVMFREMAARFEGQPKMEGNA